MNKQFNDCNMGLINALKNVEEKERYIKNELNKYFINNTSELKRSGKKIVLK